MFEAGAKWGHIAEFLAGFRLHDKTKGRTWLDQYTREYKLMQQRHPDYTGPALKHHLGRMLYRGMQLASGRWIRATIERRQHRGQKLADVFGEFST